MTGRSRRIDRKLHLRYLNLGVIDASQNSGWRDRMFAAPLHPAFLIDARHAVGVPDKVARGIRRYGLSYTVQRIASEETRFFQAGWGLRLLSLRSA